MGEAKRRAKARQPNFSIVRQLEEQIRSLPPAPMNGSDTLCLSPADYDAIRERLEISTFGTVTHYGFRIERDPQLVKGVFVGRRRGKAVWSNYADVLNALAVS